ncbi:hypothetical protein ElyMa_000169600 [Elysia marginata]|uniref:Uncharacterized protein n=1 Tax=Elysia marginata TaxID=1093978 RepID=A0AAV4EUF2_9GAST|nr:hypothetical protein ElyMa_000169600 [Elysia marginata]
MSILNMAMEEETSSDVKLDFKRLFVDTKPDMHGLIVKKEALNSTSDTSTVYNVFEEKPTSKPMLFSPKSITSTGDLGKVKLEHQHVNYFDEELEVEEKPCIEALKAVVDAYSQSSKTG